MYFFKNCNLVVIIVCGFLLSMSYYNYVNAVLMGMKLLIFFTHTYLI